MAGVGIQLKKLVKDKSFFGGVKAFTFSSIVITGPLFLCILLLTVAQQFLELTSTPYYERELFLAGMLYSFVFSQIITSGFIMVGTRYLADQIYENKEENILSSLYGMIAVTVVIGGVIGAVFFLLSPLDFMFKLVAYLFLIELIIIWGLMMYISALKYYKQIIMGFLVGVLSSIAAIWVCYVAFDYLTATHLIICVNIGFLLLMLFFINSIKKRFPINNEQYFNFLTYFSKYPSLFFVGLFYTFGLFIHAFMIWGSDLQMIVSDTYVMAPLFDVPFFYAFLTILPAMIIFVLTVETAFYNKYKSFYDKVIGSSSYQEIQNAHMKMFNVLSKEIVFIMEFQLFFTVCAIAIGTSLLPITVEQVDIFNIVTVGNYFFIIMFVVMQILLYFDDRKGALIVISSYLLVSLITAPITVLVGSYGLSCFISGLIGLVVAFGRLRYYCRNFGYFTYCAQPVEAKGHIIQEMARRLNTLNGFEGEKK
ncbi:exopolysaccharide Pel transporter PelG [Ornithinibacillus salinisoli]|uniref:Exopolysaccharide Pel transporter PelG n=2 Tax=Ornithinibacillus salinisoli TaxID=1848459 RepID=A0ABW4VX34_9BACI